MHLPFKTERTEAARGKQRQSQCCHANSTRWSLMDPTALQRHGEWCRSATPRFSSCSMLYAAFRSVFDVYLWSKTVR